MQTSRLLVLVTTASLLGAATPVAAQKAAGPSISIKLLDAGKGTKRALRYQLRADRTENVVMRMIMGLKMEMDGNALPEVALPTMEIGMRFHIGKMLSEQEARYDFAISSVKAIGRPGVADAVVEAIDKSLAGVKHLTGSAIVDTRGANRDVKLDTSKVSAEAQQMMQGMQQGLDQMAVPFPAEAVGKGARWQAKQNLVQNGMTLEQVSTFELVELQGDKGTLRVTVRQTAPRQTINTGGITAELVSHKASGLGTVKFDLARLTPKSKLTMNATYTMKIDLGGKKSPVTGKMTLTMELEPK